MLRHVEEVSFNVAATCRYYGISRQCYYGGLRGKLSRSAPRPTHYERFGSAKTRRAASCNCSASRPDCPRHPASDRIGPPMFADWVRTTGAKVSDFATAALINAQGDNHWRCKRCVAHRIFESVGGT